MTCLIANDTPPAIRGLLKRWFIEPRPNVFVGTPNPRTHQKVLEYILRNAHKDFGVLVITSAPNCQGYTIERFGPCGCSGRDPIEISGVPLGFHRPRGDGPVRLLLLGNRVGWFSPPTRGWPAPHEGLAGVIDAFPAHAGMAREAVLRGRNGRVATGVSS